MTSPTSLTGTDIGDFEKMMAVLAVITQSVISFIMNAQPSIGQQFFFGGIYEVVKYSAPAFICGILFSTSRTHPHATLNDYPRFMKDRWHVLFMPTICWTLVYLLLLPQLQQHGHYHNWQSFSWQFINGNAAPHLWYNAMMLQFIILMPLFWWLNRLINHRQSAGIIVLILALCFEIGWFHEYEVHIFHHLHSGYYLIDRLFPSFLIFAIAGILLWQFYDRLAPLLRRHWLIQLICWLIFFYIVTSSFFSYGLPVKLTNAPYYLPTMIFYNLSTISLIATVLLHWQQQQNQWLPLIHWVAVYAYRAYLSHIFWLYWCWKLITPCHLALPIIFPLLTLVTILLSFLSAYGLHALWTYLKHPTNIKIWAN